MSIVKNTADGGLLCKVYEYDEEERSLHTHTNAYLVEGRVDEEEFESIGQFMERRARLDHDEALMMGRPIYSPAEIRTQSAIRGISPDRRRTKHIIARDREHVSWREGPSVVMLDLDKPEEIPRELRDRAPSSPEEWRALIVECIPALRRVPMAWAPSSSSHVYHGDAELQGLRGQRFYFVIESGLATERFKTVLREQLIQRGLVWFTVSKSGSKLERFPFDLAVYQPERLDFAAGPICDSPLSWRPGDPKVWNPGGEYLRRSDLPSLTAEERRRGEATLQAKKRAVAAEARAARERWLADTGRTIALCHPELEPGQAETVAREAIDRGVLLPDFILIDRDGEKVAVGELLANPTEHDGRRFADPLEPGYRNDPRIAVFQVDDEDRCRIYSHAHGGQSWRCEEQIISVRLGVIQESVSQIKQALELDTCDLYRHGDTIVHVDQDAAEIQSLDVDGLALRLQDRFDVRGLSRRAGEWVPKNISPRDLRALMSQASTLPIPTLTVVSRGPFVRIDGSPVDVPGYDPASEVLYLSDSPSPPRARTAVGIAEAEEALHQLLDPFSGFALKTDLDRGVLLTALLTSLARLSLPIAPGFLIDAPTAGSGKTTLAESIGVLQTGSRIAATMLPQGDEEIRKQSFASARAGSNFLLYDNVERGSEITSPAIANLITSPNIEQRVLGQSITERRPNRMTVVFTGNNISRGGDLNRRILPLRLDPEIERPETRHFDFDPVSRIQAQWLPLRLAGLELFSAWLQDGAPEPPTQTGFPDWDHVVRGTVCWVIDRLDVGQGFADPADAFRIGYIEDTEAQLLGDLFEAWHTVFGDSEIHLKEVDHAVHTTAQELGLLLGDAPGDEELMPHEQLAKACRALEEHRDVGLADRAGFGQYLSANVDRVVRGFKLVKGAVSGGSRKWSVRRVENDQRVV